jgi:magnesium-protoporphyrin IX monomethyl ester (oxidative) cyclase
MRILLVNPPNPANYYNQEVYLPSSLLYIASALIEKGHELRLLDLKSPKYKNNNQTGHEELFIQAVASFSPDLIGFGCLFSGNFTQLLRLSVLSKERFPQVPVIIGGIHPTIYALEILANCSSIDWIILSEGEESIVDFIDVFKEGRSDFSKIDGFAYKNSGKIYINPKTKFIKDADSIVFPAYNLVDLADYYVDTSLWHNPKKLQINTSVPIISSRSCPNRCNFCSMFLAMGPVWRPRSPKNVVDEIEYVYKTYNHRHFSFLDDNFSLSKPRVLEICDLIIKRKIDIQFETPNGLAINTLDEEVLDAMVAAGMVRTYVAIESGSDYIRNKIMRKNLSQDKIYAVTKLLKKYKELNVAAFFIIGMPEETSDTLMDTYEMIKKIEVNRVFMMNVVPFPGTEVFAQARRDNLLVDTDPDKLYLADDRYLTNYDRFFLKPYKLELAQLKEFREKCEQLPCVKKSTGKGGRV